MPRNRRFNGEFNIDEYIETDSLLDNDYNQINCSQCVQTSMQNTVYNVPSKATTSQNINTVIDVVIDNSVNSVKDMHRDLHRCFSDASRAMSKTSMQVTAYTEYDKHTNKYLIRMIEILNIFLDYVNNNNSTNPVYRRYMGSVSNKNDKKGFHFLKNIFNNGKNNKDFQRHNCIIDFLTHVSKTSVYYYKLSDYVLTSDYIVEEDYRKLFEQLRHDEKQKYYIIDTAYNSPEIRNKLVTITGKYDSFETLSKFLKHWDTEQVSPFTKDALETFKTLVVNELPIQCIITDHQYPDTDPRHVYNIDITFVNPINADICINESSMYTSQKKNFDVDNVLVNNNSNKNINNLDEKIQVNCPLILYKGSYINTNIGVQEDKYISNLGVLIAYYIGVRPKRELQKDLQTPMKNAVYSNKWVESVNIPMQAPIHDSHYLFYNSCMRLKRH